MLITSLIILLVLSTFLSSGVICLFQLNEILWSSLSNFISPLSSLLTFIVLSFLVILKEQGLQEHFMPFGLMRISFLNCNLPLQMGQSKVMNLLDSFCSSFRLTTAGSSFESSKSSGIGCFLIVLYSFLFRHLFYI